MMYTLQISFTHLGKNLGKVTTTDVQDDAINGIWMDDSHEQVDDSHQTEGPFGA